MISSQAVPWYNLPPREFPVKRWQRQRFGFHVTLAPSAHAAAPERRPFPARLWLEGKWQPPTGHAAPDGTGGPMQP